MRIVVSTFGLETLGGIRFLAITQHLIPTSGRFGSLVFMKSVFMTYPQ